MNINKLNEEFKNIISTNILEKTNNSRNVENIIDNIVARYLKDYSIKKEQDKYIITANTEDLWQESRRSSIGNRIFNALDRVKEVVSLDGWDSRDSNPDKESLIIEVKSNVNEELDIESLMHFLKETIDQAKSKLDKCYERAQYRFIDNVSYNPDEIRNMIYNFNKQIKDEVDDLYNSIYGQIG